MYVPLINVRKPLDIYILISKCLNYCLSIATKNTVYFIPFIAPYFQPRRLYLCNLLSI